MNEQYSASRSNVSMLGKVLAETIKDALREHILERVETIRKLSKSYALAMMLTARSYSPPYKICPTTSCRPLRVRFSQFLNPANTAKQYHSISPKGEAASNPEVIARTLRKLKNQPGTERRHHQKSSGIAVAGTGPNGTLPENYPSYTDSTNGGSERLLKTAR
ncbi:phosphoenolpyruvate carboxylase [Shigella flexneri]